MDASSLDRYITGNWGEDSVDTDDLSEIMLASEVDEDGEVLFYTHADGCDCSVCQTNDALGYDADVSDPSQYCRHGTFIGSWWGPDYMCDMCESGWEYCDGCGKVFDPSDRPDDAPARFAGVHLCVDCLPQVHALVTRRFIEAGRFKDHDDLDGFVRIVADAINAGAKMGYAAGAQKGGR